MTNATPRTSQLPLPFSLAGQSVLIIGGSSGIGFAAGQLLVDLGAYVTLAARDAARLAAAASRLEGRVQTRPADVSDPASLRSLFESIEQLDHVFVTAAAAAVGPIATTNIATLRPMLDNHIWGTYEIARLAALRLRAGGSLTVLSNSFVYRPMPGVAVMAAAMAGVEGMVRALALELAPLRVNAVQASATDTPMFHAFYGGADDAQVAAVGAGLLLGRVARAEEAASAALFCMANPYVTGTAVVVDGGASLA